LGDRQNIRPLKNLTIKSQRVFARPTGHPEKQAHKTRTENKLHAYLAVSKNFQLERIAVQQCGKAFPKQTCWGHRWLGDGKGIRPAKSLSLVCWWQHFDWCFARLIAPVVTTTSPNLSEQLWTLSSNNPEWRHSGTTS